MSWYVYRSGHDFIRVRTKQAALETAQAHILSRQGNSAAIQNCKREHRFHYWSDQYGMQFIEYFD